MLKNLSSFNTIIVKITITFRVGIVNRFCWSKYKVVKSEESCWFVVSRTGRGLNYTRTNSSSICI